MTVSLEQKRYTINIIANYFSSTKGYNYFPSTTSAQEITSTYAQWRGYWTRSSRRSSDQLIKYIPELARMIRNDTSGYAECELRTGSQAYTPPQHNSYHRNNPMPASVGELTAYFQRVGK